MLFCSEKLKRLYEVNATDLRKMAYPSRDQLMRLGLHVQDRMPDQETIDKILEMECEKP